MGHQFLTWWRNIKSLKMDKMDIFYLKYFIRTIIEKLCLKISKISNGGKSIEKSI